MLQEYIQAVLKQPDAHDLYKWCYDRNEGETDLQYIERCATLDFDDGDYQAAVYQNLYNQITNNS